MLNRGLSVGLVKNHKTARNTDIFAVLAQNSHTNRVKRAHKGHKTTVGRVLARERRDSFAHLLSRFVGKSYGQNIVGRGLFGGDNVGNAVRQRLGLARAGTSLN